MADLTLEEYRNTISPEKDVNQFLREKAQKFFGADFTNHKGFKDPNFTAWEDCRNS
jgi:hypothetical protein